MRSCPALTSSTASSSRLAKQRNAAAAACRLLLSRRKTTGHLTARRRRGACVPLDHATARRARQSTGERPGQPRSALRSELVAQVAARRSDARAEAFCLQPPALRLVGAPLASGVATPQESDLVCAPGSVRESNIVAAKAVADAVRTSLGPRGMDKMVPPARLTLRGLRGEGLGASRRRDTAAGTPPPVG